MAQVKSVAKIHAAATYFVFVSRDPKKIAKALNLKNVRTVYRWVETPEWEEVLEVCGYEGDRGFENLPTRDTESGVSFQAARRAYLKTIADGVAEDQRANVAAEVVGMTARKIRDWARRYGWREAGAEKRN